MLNRRV